MSTQKQKGGLWRNNGLSIVAFLIFLVTLVGQVFTGLKQYNSEQQEEGQPAVSLGGYLESGHFIEATFENWESEFLQMGMFVVLTACLYQKGSAESNDPDEKKPDENLPLHPNAPWPMRKGGITRKLYENSLSIALFSLFFFSFLLHWFGSWETFNQHQTANGKPTDSLFEYLGNSKFWFESFQNWQSEFLSVGMVIVLTIFLRQKGSSQSKTVDAPDSQTGD